MQLSSTQTAHRAASRAVYGALAVALLAAAIHEAATHGSGWWLFAAFLAGPDLALFFGIGTQLEHGQLHPRAVPLYNALHSFWGPAALALAAIVLPGGILVGGLAWACHVSVDRAVGYGMRTRDGFQRS
ncbi:MAG TPA: DUF4260 family protein [Gaiellales bacterium]|jgi:hypothetical protein|nr:DUF4260 family protein [Gaiellales bacterium]